MYDGKLGHLPRVVEGLGDVEAFCLAGVSHLEVGSKGEYALGDSAS